MSLKKLLPILAMMAMSDMSGLSNPHHEFNPLTD
jgi:hypothetical protein